MIPLRKNLFDQVLAHLRQEFPNEGCGVLAGRGGEAQSVFPMRNAEASPVSYRMEARDQLALFRRLDREKLEVIGIYHSHPASDAYPSAQDCSKAFYDDPFYLIVSLQDSCAQPRVFWIRQGKIEEDKIEWRE